MELDDCILRFDHMPASWTDDVKKCKDRKALTQIYLHLSNTIFTGYNKGDLSFIVSEVRADMHKEISP